MHRNLLTALCALALVGSLAGCGGRGDSDAKIEARVKAQLSEGGLDDKSAGCVAGVLIKDVGADKMKDVDLSDAQPAGSLGEEIAAAAIRATATCKIDPSTLQG